MKLGKNISKWKQLAALLSNGWWKQQLKQINKSMSFQDFVVMPEHEVFHEKQNKKYLKEKQ